MSRHERLCWGQAAKRLLLVNTNELNAEYKKKNPLDKIGFSKFCKHGLKFVVLVIASGMHDVCVCQIHQNTKPLTVAIHGRNHGDNKKILEKMVCSVENQDYAPSL